MNEYCFSCGKTTAQAPLIKFNNIHTFCLCDECVNTAAEKLGLKDKKYIEKDLKYVKKLTPKKIKSKLDKYIIGQEEAKIKISIAIYNHLKRINNSNMDLQKSNILITGPSGTGKTEIARVISKLLKVPFVIVDATSLTQAGYVGDDVETILSKLIEEANGDIELAEKGIIYIDEIDKIAMKSENTSITRDVSGEGVQQALLKIIEGHDSISVPLNEKRKSPFSKNVNISTKNILFICAGAFEGIDDITKEKNTVGFNTSNSVSNVSKNNNLVKYGLLKEFVGRFSVITQTNKLTKTDLKDILLKTKNSIINEYTQLFKLDNIDVEFSDEYLDYIVDYALTTNTGARGLRFAIEDTIQDLMFNAPDMILEDKLVISLDNINLLHKKNIV